MTDTIQATPAQVAIEFAKVLRHWLTPNEMQEVLRRNKTAAYQNGACASHDFCDANMAMAEAFKKFRIDPAVDNSDVLKLWNAAWDIAHKSGFAVA
jgi:hypothetical protein